MAKVYVATIQVAVVSENETDASDAIAEEMREMIGGFSTGIIDWAYLKLQGQWLYPTETVINSEGYLEGMAFDTVTAPRGRRG